MDPKALPMESHYLAMSQYCIRAGCSFARELHGQTEFPLQNGHPEGDWYLQRRIHLGLPSMLVLATLRPALVTAAQQPDFPVAATGQLLCVNAAVLGGMELCIDVWEVILQVSKLSSGATPAFPCALWAALAKIHPLIGTGIEPTMLCACPRYRSPWLWQATPHASMP